MTSQDQQWALFLVFIFRQYNNHLVRKELVILNQKEREIRFGNIQIKLIKNVNGNMDLVKARNSNSQSVSRQLILYLQFSGNNKASKVNI